MISEQLWLYAGDPCDDSLQKLARDTELRRKYGTASSLGEVLGYVLMRGRFSGAILNFMVMNSGGI